MSKDLRFWSTKAVIRIQQAAGSDPTPYAVASASFWRATRFIMISYGPVRVQHNINGQTKFVQYLFSYRRLARTWDIHW